MNNQEVLANAIGKAIVHGYVRPKYPYPDNNEDVEIETLMVCWENIIFSHSFAKAFWSGEKELDVCYEGYCQDEEGNTDGKLSEAWRIKEWQYHLQQMILEENPLSYLEKFL